MDKGIVKPKLAIPMFCTAVIFNGKTMVIIKQTKDVRNEVISRIAKSANTRERIASMLERIPVLL